MLKHLSNEFYVPFLGTQIEELAVNSFWAKSLNKELKDPSLLDTVKEKLLIVRERVRSLVFIKFAKVISITVSISDNTLFKKNRNQFIPCYC